MLKKARSSQISRAQIKEIRAQLHRVAVKKKELNLCMDMGRPLPLLSG